MQIQQVLPVILDSGITEICKQFSREMNLENADLSHFSKQFCTFRWGNCFGWLDLLIVEWGISSK